jgi:hypothetical protein
MDSFSASGGGGSRPILMSSSSSAVEPTLDVLPPQTAARKTPVLALLAITFAAVLVHGYHLGVDDAAIYVPAIKSVADPGLYPFGSEFFMSHAHLSFFSNIVGDSARLTRVPIDTVIFIWHVAGIFLLLLAAWRLLDACFRNDAAKWGGVALLAAVLSVPVAGTALVIMDPYVTARSLSTPATLFAIACFLSNRRKEGFAWLLLTAAVHPQMSVYAVLFMGCLMLVRQRAALRDGNMMFGLLAAPFLFQFQPAQGAAREALFSRTYFFVSNWTWYEWMGVFAPLALLWWFSRLNLRDTRTEFRTLARALIPFGLLFTAAGVLLTIPASLENYTRLQPMRAFHIVYVVFFALLGGLLGEYLLRRGVWRWLGLFLPLAAAMWLLQQDSFPASSHVEWPGRRSDNTWTAAFLWIRGNTPKDAVFGLDPNYMHLPGEDMHGFRAVAERSVLADNIKDSGAVSLFPQLAAHWKSQTEAEKGWDSFHRPEFENLARQYPVTWVLTRHPGPAGLICPYENRDLAVCRISGR